MASALRLLLILTLALTTTARAPPDPASLVLSAFTDLTSLSNSLRATADSITLYNAGWRGYKIATAFSAITTRVDTAISQLRKITPLPDDDARRVVAALGGFVRAQCAALDAVVAKHGLVTLVPHVEGIRRAVVELEGDIVDRFEEVVAAWVPSSLGGAVGEQFEVLGVKIHECIATYEEPLLNDVAAALLWTHVDLHG